MKCSFSLFPAILIMTSLSPSQAQQADSVVRHKRVIDSVLVSENLRTLVGKPAFFYSNGHEERAKTIHQLFANCIHYYEAIFPGTTFNVNIYLLDALTLLKSVLPKEMDAWLQQMQ